MRTCQQRGPWLHSTCLLSPELLEKRYFEGSHSVKLAIAEYNTEAFEKCRRLFDWPEVSLLELQRLYQWVEQTKGYKPLIIDADDLQKDPGELVELCCVPADKSVHTSAA